MKHFALAAALSLVSLAGCSTNPTTGRSQFNALSRDQEITMGAEAKPELVKEYGGEVEREDVKAYVHEVGMKLAAVTEGDNPNLPWEFTLLDSDVINAFALPGGKVFMSRGLATKMKNEAQLASVLGHEVGHVTARHINDRMSQSMIVSAVAGVSSILLEDVSGIIRDVTPQVVQLGGQSVLLQFSRKQELEADSLGVRYMVKNDYDPTASLDVMAILEESMQENRGMEFFSTHPYPKTRIESLQKLFQSDYAFAINNPQYKTFSDRFQQRLLSKLAVAYPNAGPARFVTRSEMKSEWAKLGMEEPAVWCAHCAGR